jgi:hypothetical protein
MMHGRKNIKIVFIGRSSEYLSENISCEIKTMAYKNIILLPFRLTEKSN